MNEDESILGLLYKQIEDEKLAISAAVLQGGASDYAAYRDMTGRVLGMSIAQRLINEMVDRLRKQRD